MSVVAGLAGTAVGRSGQDRWEVFVDGLNRRTFVNPDTWDSFDGIAEAQFEADFITSYSDRRDREMRFICTDTGVYGAAARAQAALERVDVVRAKDRLTDLIERADALVIQAASLATKPTESQLQLFAVRHANVLEDLRVLEDDMARLRAKVDLAGTALVDATSVTVPVFESAL